ncbi:MULTISPECIES: long-chain-fatty-acid--CoA ligase [Pseudomonas]|jgi:acyl-CoA synthetase (AMP-forming)/AMP-acid ligase II|uniref:long-chain-fatty-acid--CoA ligase n=1 Tax=Pseudomonas TaxID=286 RepID=UPI000E6B22AE|nr:MULTISPECIES: long-chain-fatty-acid--CoA ligase [Pseudomonas]HBK48168.1 long-chain fatty acid--CoA ligase [Pseudomonas sp.]MDW2777483.1 long-chain-fatty-acid--CoA ligase [Pseudomonas sp. BEA3.1]RIZ40522.1 long-chain fatty acid--CoA ligase [Pseudomonas putida]TFF51856.1 long-chain fatty acid--CoA ligase [Pseudomonas putida]TFW34959.1 long-chain-fatty-acid--CoA ligase [Pseudomonas putida]
MYALMQDRQLLISSLIEHAALNHGQVEIVSRTCEGQTLYSNYKTLRERALKLAKALQELGVGQGDCVGSLAWNTHRHMELYFAVPGMGAVLNTVNPRLHAEQIEYIINHAEDKVLFFDLTFAELIRTLRPALKFTATLVVMTDRAHKPKGLDDCLCYEDLIDAHDDTYQWPQLDEKLASSLCYTSGTTGNPKGVLYSHRSTLLHAFNTCAMDGLQLSSRDRVLLTVPLFHVNAWGLPYASAMCGAKVVLPGPWLDGQNLLSLLQQQRCTFSIGVPTVWLGLLQFIDEHPDVLTGELALERVVLGGAAAPRALIERLHHVLGATSIQAWGMSETSPMGTIGNLLPKHLQLPLEQQIDVRAKAGRPVYGVEVQVVDEQGQVLPRDGRSAGHLKVRGPWVAAGYFKGEGGQVVDEGGWLETGDVASIDADGYLQITDRSKDVIKSGGEWISSIDLENAAIAHHAVQEAAVIGRPHSRWQERPLLIVVARPGVSVTGPELLAFLSTRVAKWWLPDDVVFVDELPHTATGKLQKTRLREQFNDFVFTSERQQAAPQRSDVNATTDHG